MIVDYCLEVASSDWSSECDNDIAFKVSWWLHHTLRVKGFSWNVRRVEIVSVESYRSIESSCCYRQHWILSVLLILQGLCYCFFESSLFKEVFKVASIFIQIICELLANVFYRLRLCKDCHLNSFKEAISIVLGVAKVKSILDVFVFFNENI